MDPAPALDAIMAIVLALLAMYLMWIITKP